MEPFRSEGSKTLNEIHRIEHLRTRTHGRGKGAVRKDRALWRQAQGPKGLEAWRNTSRQAAAFASAPKRP